MRWAPIPSHPGYEASDLGQIRTVDRVIARQDGTTCRLRGAVRKVHLNRQTGRLQLLLNNRRTRRVHQLVLEAFVGPCPPGHVGCHRNDDHLDNRLENLYWGTASQNQRDAVRNGVHGHTKRLMCPRRHSLSGPNLVPSKDARMCLACNRARGYIRRHPELDLQELADR